MDTDYDWMDSELDVWRFNENTHWWDCTTLPPRPITRARLRTLDIVDRMYGPLVRADGRPDRNFGLEPEVAQSLKLADQLWGVMVALNSMDGEWAYGQSGEPWGDTATALKSVLTKVTGTRELADKLYERCLEAYEKPSLHFAAVVA